MRGKRMISLLSSLHSGSDKNPGYPPLEKKTKMEGKEEKLKEEAKLSVGPFPQGSEDQVCILVSFKLLFHNLW
jgi:hypothetical protein